MGFKLTADYRPSTDAETKHSSSAKLTLLKCAWFDFRTSRWTPSGISTQFEGEGMTASEARISKVICEANHAIVILGRDSRLIGEFLVLGNWLG